MQLTADIIYGFTNTLLLDRFDNPCRTPEFHLELWGLMCSDHPRVAVAAPRFHAKSTAITHTYVLANVCFRVKQHVLIVSDTEGQAVDFLRDIKTEFLENEALKANFGIRGLIKDRETEIVVQFTDGHQFRIVAKGSEQKIRGMKWRNKRPDLIVGDDLENDEIVMNEERRDKFRKWVYNALLPCGSKFCTIRIVGTILHLDSMLERLMPEIDGPRTAVEPLKQSGYGQKDSAWKSIRYKAHTPDFEHILWEEQHNEESLKIKRQSYIEQGNPEGYSQEYLNYPIDESHAIFRKGDFKDISDHDGPEEFYASADLAISAKKQRAYTVMTVASVTSDNILRYRDVIRFRGDSHEIIDQIFEIVTTYSIEVFFIEKENIANTLESIIYQEMEERGIYFNMELVTPTKDKVSRARPLQARMRAHKVEFDMGASWFPSFQQELLQFPRGAYVDQVDAAAWIPLGLNLINDVPTRAEWEEAEWEQEYEETVEFMNTGRNKHTGY